MTLALWCVAIGAALPYLWLPAQWNVRFAAGYDNRHPRKQQETLTDAPWRAVCAHKNAFEAFPIFAAAVLTAHVTNADAQMSGILAVSWVVFRLLHGVFYIADIHLLRSTAWSLGMAAVTGLFGLAAMAG